MKIFEQTAVMNYVSKFLSNFKEFYNEINSATLTGAIDVVIIQQEDGSYSSSPFHVRFGKIGVLRSREKVVDIEINGEPVNIHMKLGETGEAFFVQETEEFAEVPSHLATSPIPSYPDIEQGLARLKASEGLPIPSKANFEARPTNDHVPPDENQPVSGQPEDSNHSVSMQDSVYYETSETAPGVRSSPCQTTLGATVVDLDSDHEGQSLSTSVQSHSQVQDRKCEVPIFNEHQISAATYASEFRTLAKALGHTSISDSALAVIDTNRSLLHTKEIASESSSLTNNRFMPMYLKNETAHENADNSLHENVLMPRDNVKNFLATSTPSSQLIMTDDDKQKAKKKRRKRSIIRKRKSREASAYPRNVDTSDEEPEEIFQMDVDDDDDKDKTGSSLPASSYKPIIPTSSSHVALGKVHSVSSLPDVGNFPSTSSEEHHKNNWQQYKSSMQLNLESHPFSDGDVTPVLSPVTSRPPTPKSDTEYETQRQEAASQTESGENRWSWTWGELPVPPKGNSDISREKASSDDESIQTKQLETADQAEQRSMLGGMFRFMRKTKKLRHQPESEGIYLDDLNLEELDPEIAKLYFPPRNSGLHIPSAAIKMPTVAKDEDVESGNGSSLPVSPHSVEGGMGSIHGGMDSDSDERHPIFDFKGYNDLAMSLCGGLMEFDNEVLQERFMHSIITYDEFCENPNILNNPDLVIRLNNKHYNWQTVAPMVLSLILYQRPLAERTVNNLVNENMPKKTKKSETKAGGYSSWFSWRRSGTSEDEAKKMDERKKTDSESSVKSEKSEKSEKEDKSEKSDKLEPPSIVEQEAETKKADSTKPNSSASNSPAKSSAAEKLLKEEMAYASTSSEAEETAPGLTVYKSEAGEIKRHFYKGNERFKKTLRLTSEQISLLNLREGPNEVVFSVTTAYQGTTRCKCHIYLWHHDDKIVVSDIDGTITKSDVLGHILPIIGKDWAQSGVAQLFTKIKNNGYQFLYLSARAIGQAHITREYLKSIRQGDLCLPEGPLLLNPSSLISAFHREVIEKKPEEFKISCLKDIQALFPTFLNPFYAGYGNRINDVWAYRAVGIPMSRIFTINHRGELKHELTNTFQSTYSGLSHVVDHLFPPLRRTPMKDGVLSSDFEGSEEFSAFTYWRPAIPEVDTIPESPTKTADKSKIEEKAKPLAVL